MIEEDVLKEINTCPQARSKAEERYLGRRKFKANISKLCFYICRIFPIKKNRINICSYEGKGGMGCNAKSIVKKLHELHPEYEIVWHLNDTSLEMPDYVRKVSNSLWSRAYWLTTSTIWIDNYRKPWGTVKRKGQYYINVNHYNIAIKCTGILRGKGFSPVAYMVSKNDSDMIDKLVIDSTWSEIILRKGMVYCGEYLKVGSPRCDVLYGNRIKQKSDFRKKYSIEEDAHIVMYAPTFREGAKNGKRSVFLEKWSIDFERLISCLENKFGGKWYICLRVHPQLIPAIKQLNHSEFGDRIIDETKNEDMYEVLSAMDAYITDYSSSCFEAALMEIPVFIYADDIEQYTKDRGALLWQYEKLNEGKIFNNKSVSPQFDIEFPFTISDNNDNLEKNIKEFSEEQYRNILQEFWQKVGMIFDGKATERVVDEINKVMEKR